MTPRVFGVDYQFLSCGDVFTQGLVHAAAQLGIAYTHADWSAVDLPQQIARVEPDLVFVVHGRRFVDRWRHHPAFAAWPTAVWLLDEPYEVDETVAVGRACRHVFLNDGVTLARHADATVLPVCYDPVVHHPGTMARPHAVGFIGGANPTREAVLVALAEAGLLRYGYIVGGVFSHPAVAARVVGRNIPPAATAAWYQQTQIVINVFRDRHHFNRQATPGTALNPRVYEATACGALVVSEWRPELDTRVPELPTFRTPKEAVAVVGRLMADPARVRALQARAAATLAPHTYAARLRTVLETVGLCEVAA
jgi:hypothetical protein